MKTTAAFLSSALMIFSSCQNNHQPESKPAVQQSKPDTGWSDCYVYVSGRDTVALQLRRNGNNISGNLVYNFYEKDRNTGTISGTIYGDTLLAGYTFMSEGVQSKRKVCFLKTGSQLTEGISRTSESGVLNLTYSYRFTGVVLKPSADCSIYFPPNK